MAKKQVAAAGGNGIISFWNMLFLVTMSGIGFAAGTAYGRHSVMVAPTTDAVLADALPKGEDESGAIPDDTFSAFERIPDARGRRVTRAGSATPQVVLAPGAEQALAAAAEGSAAPAVAEAPVAAPAPVVEPAAAPAPVAVPAPVQPVVAKTEQVLASGAGTAVASARKVGRAASGGPTFEIVAAGARTWEEANEASRSLQDGGLKTTVSAVRDERGGQRWLVHVQGAGDPSEKKRQEQLIRRLLSSR